MRRNKKLLLFLLLETLCVTYFIKIPALIPIASFLYIFSGIAISCLLLYLPVEPIRIKKPIASVRVVHVYQLALLLFGGLVVYQFTHYWIMSSPLSYTDADMIPIMEVMSKRYLQGDFQMVYQPIQEIWNGIQPIYLPAMWMPFMVSEQFSIDPRWITSFAVFLSFSMVIVLWKKHWQKMSGAFILLTSGILCLWLYTDRGHNFIRLSEEGIVVFYYSLLVVALMSENFFFVGITVALCALSRYTIAGWLPIILIYLLFMHKRKRDAVYFLLSFSILVVVLVVLPFGFEPIRIAFYQPEQYVQHAKRIWQESPEFFTKSMGMAKFFGPQRVELQHNVLITLSFLVPLVMLLTLFFLQKKMKKSFSNIPLATLKVTLVIVYSFIDVPYQYLFYTSSFVSLIAITWISSAVEKNEQPMNRTIEVL